MTTPRVFISYTRSDADWARSFAEALKQRGVRVWLDQWEIPAGVPFREALEAGLRESEVFVALIDPGFSLNPNLLFELGAAIGMGKRVVPIVPRQADTAKLPSELRNRQCLLRDSPEGTAEQLAHDLAAA